MSEPRGPEFVAFDSVEDAFEYMRKGEEFGNRNLHPKQAAITWGDHWVRFYDVANRLIIFGRVDTEEENYTSEAKGIDQITDSEERRIAMDEVAESMRVIWNSHQRGLMWGWAYSKGEHDLGSTHRFNMWPISEHLYTVAKEAQWDVDAITEPEARRELEQAYQEYRAHALAVFLSGDQP